MASIEERSWTNQSGKTSKRFRVTYTDVEGSRRRKDFPVKREALAFINSLTKVSETGGFVPSGNRTDTFKTAAEAYLEACRLGRDGNPPLEPDTLTSYRWHVEHLILPIWSDRPLASIQETDVEALRNRMVAERARSTAARTLFTVRSIFEHARRTKVISTNPAANVKLARDRRKEAVAGQSLPIHTKEEMASILRAAERLRHPDKPTKRSNPWVRFEVMLHTLVFCGLRMSELRGLARGAVSLESKTLRVFQRADKKGIIGPPKSSYGVRMIHISDDLRDRLASWMRENPDPASGLMFPTDSGKPISHRNLSMKMWRAVQVKAGVRILNPHSSRHFFASFLLDQGVRLKQLQESLGHHDPMFTMRVYGHLFQDPEDRALRAMMAQKMSAMLIPASED